MKEPMHEANMEDIRNYLGKLFDRYQKRSLRERAWSIQDKLDADMPISSPDAKFVDFYWDFYNDCGALTPEDFTALMLFSYDPEKRILYIDKNFGWDSSIMDAIKSILPNIKINTNQRKSIDLQDLKPDECYISTIGNSYFSSEIPEMTLNVFSIQK